MCDSCFHQDLKHTNIVQLFYYHELPTEIYLIIEFCNGGDLAEYLLKKETLSEMSIKHLTRHIAGALQAIHQRQIIHRDIKPQNILLSFRSTSSTQSFKDATIKLADFGFARYLSSSDMAATLCGSPLYMAPEILLGRRYDSKVDLWSTGTILYQCLTGEAPFKVSMIIRINFNIRVLIDTI
jgi:serine/threonine-protein kinase ULK/ATG1